MTALALSRSPELRGIVYILISTVTWSSAGLFIRLVPADNWTQSFWRGMGGFIAILAILIVTDRGAGLRRILTMGRPGWSVAFLSATGMVLYILSFQYTSVAHIAVLYGTTPFMAIAIAWIWMSEAPGRQVLIASGIALVGILVMVSQATGEGALIGDGLMILVSLAMALTAVIARRNPGLAVLSAGCMGALGSALLSAPAAAPFSIDAGQIALLCLFGFISMGPGYALFSLGAKLVAPGKAALITTLEMPLSPFWVWLFLGETVDPVVIVGGAIVMAAVIMATTATSPPRP